MRRRGRQINNRTKGGRLHQRCRSRRRSRPSPFLTRENVPYGTTVCVCVCVCVRACVCVCVHARAWNQKARAWEQIFTLLRSIRSTQDDGVLRQWQAIAQAARKVKRAEEAITGTTIGSTADCSVGTSGNPTRPAMDITWHFVKLCFEEKSAVCRGFRIQRFTVISTRRGSCSTFSCVLTSNGTHPLRSSSYAAVRMWIWMDRIVYVRTGSDQRVFRIDVIKYRVWRLRQRSGRGQA